MKFRHLLVSTLLTLIAMAAVVPASAAQQETIIPLGPTISGFAPARLVISFPHTTIISTNVTSEAGGYFTYTVSTQLPDSVITYSLNQSDIYTVNLVFGYPVASNGNITWHFNCPGLSPMSENYQFFNSTTVSLKLTFALLIYQHIPSAQEIANATAAIEINYLQQMLQQQQQSSAAEVQQLQDEVYTAYIMLGVSLMFSAAALVVIIRRRSSS